MELPLASIERIMRNAGAEKLSSESVHLLRESTDELGEELAQDAVRIAREDNRSTITADDIEKAINM